MSLANKFGIPQGLLDAAKAALDEANEYQKKVQAHMAKKGIKSMSDLSADQKKKFFNDLDAMHTAKHEEVEQVEEGSGPKEKQKTPYRDINSPASRAAADKRREEMDKEEKSEKGKKLLGKIAAKNEEVESVEEGSEDALKNYFKKAVSDLSNRQIKLNTGVGDANDAKKMQDRKKGLGRAAVKIASKMEEVESVEEAESHQAKTTMKHISKPTAGEKKAAKDIKPGVAGYRDRVAMLKSAEARGALKKEEVELTQEDLDFIASLNQAEVAEGQLRNFSPHSDLAGRGRLSGYNKTAAGKKRETDRETERLKDKMKFTKGQGGIAGPKGKLPEEVELEDFTVEEIEEYMQTEEFSQLDELSKDTIARYIKKRSHDVATQGALTRKHAMDAEAKKKENGGYTTKSVRDSDDKANRAFMKGWKHRENIAKAVDRLTKG